MLIDRRANAPSNSFIYNLTRFGIALALTGTLVLVGCDSTDASEEPQIEELIISPSSVSIAVGEQADFSAVALTAAGDTIRDLDLRWWSTDTTVFTVADNGIAAGQSPGSAFCKVEITADIANLTNYRGATQSKANKRIFVGRDSAFVSVF